MADTFSAKINEWIKETEQRQVAVLKESTQRLVSKMQSRIPVDTGFARASIMGSLEAMPQFNEARGTRGARYSYDGSQITTTIASATLKDTIFVGYTANYVEYLEYGRSNQAPSGFVGVSAMEWPSIVAEVSAELKNMVTG